MRISSNVWLKLSFIIVLFTTLGCSQSQENVWPKSVINDKPNIIWLVCEDQSPDFLPMYGDYTLELPTLSSLANDGVIFDNAFSPAPVCAPARSAIITGMYQTTLGTHNMRTYNPNKKENQPSINVPIYSPILPEDVRVFTNYLRANGYYCTNNAKEDYNFKTPLGTWDDSGNKASYRNRPENAPVFAVYNYGITHESQIWKNGKEELFVDPECIEVPPYFPDNEIIRHDLAVNYSNLNRLDSQLAKVIKQLKEDGLYENSYIFFYGDHGGPFPRHKRSVYDTGLKVPMIIKYPENNMSGSRNDEFISFIDLAPTILSIAGIKPPQHMQGKAKLGAFKSADKDEFIYAASDRFDECYDKKRAVRSKKFKYIRNYMTDVPYELAVSYRMQMPMMQKMTEMDSLGQLKGVEKLWFAKEKPNEELYDLEIDPYELNNLAEQTDYSNLLTAFRATLDAWEISTGDLGTKHEQELIEEWLPEGKASVLSIPKYELNSNGLKLSSPQHGAVLLWRTKGSSSWNLYDKPIALEKGSEIEIAASRIGFKSSPVTLIKADL